MVRANYPGYVKRRGVCIYFKESLSLRFLDFPSNLDECLVYITHLTNQKDAISITMGNFNVRSSNWCKYDKSNKEGAQIDSVTSTYGLVQLICERTYILPNSPSCIDLIFTNQMNLVVDSGTHPSLHPTCHNQIIHCKMNLEVEYPSPYQSRV